MKDGENIKYYDTGEILSKFNIIDYKKHGEYTYYYQSGEIMIKYYYLDGEKHGEYIYYFISGEIMIKYYYIDGVYVTKLDWISYTRNIKFGLLGL